MSEVVILNFGGILAVDDVVARLRTLQEDYMVDLRETRVAERDEWGKVHVTPAIIWWSDAESSAA